MTREERVRAAIRPWLTSLSFGWCEEDKSYGYYSYDEGRWLVTGQPGYGGPGPLHFIVADVMKALDDGTEAAWEIAEHFLLEGTQPDRRLETPPMLGWKEGGQRVVWVSIEQWRRFTEAWGRFRGG